jgi:peptidoglycan/LPS O-acetylase OafA/YrhL
MTGAALALLLASHERPDLDARAAWRWGVFLLWVGPIVMFIVGVLPWPGGGAWYGSGAALLIGALALLVRGLRRGRPPSEPTPSPLQPPRPSRASVATAIGA